MKNYGSKLKELREEYGYSQEQIARYLNIDQSNLSKIERNIRNLNVNLLEKLCLLYNCTPQYILGESEEYTSAKIAFRKNKKVDLNVIAKVNETMSYLNLLNKLNQED